MKFRFFNSMDACAEIDRLQALHPDARKLPIRDRAMMRKTHEHIAYLESLGTPAAAVPTPTPTPAPAAPRTAPVAAPATPRTAPTPAPAAPEAKAPDLKDLFCAVYTQPYYETLKASRTESQLRDVMTRHFHFDGIAAAVPGLNSALLVEKYGPARAFSGSLRIQRNEKLAKLESFLNPPAAAMTTPAPKPSTGIKPSVKPDAAAPKGKTFQQRLAELQGQ